MNTELFNNAKKVPDHTINENNFLNKYLVNNYPAFE